MAEKAPRRRRALITGASSGIGRELARIFAIKGYDVAISARRVDLLDGLAEQIRAAVAGARVVRLPADLLDPAAPGELFAALRRRRFPVDVLVNNAGTTDVEPFHRASEDRLLDMLQLNVTSVTALTRLFLPGMVRRGHGRLLNVASLAAFQPVPSMALYAATKAFVLSLTEALSEELRGTGVTATALCPGLTDTEMVRGALAEATDVDKLPSFFVMDAAAVATAGYHACMSGKVVEVPGIANEWAATWVRLQPRWAVRALGGAAARSLPRD
ncbi:MAG: SDR family oxidoreductase [Thermoanaerobaculia bacterium]|nr:SDR family oxidoreductase [Thermoanaerobaculia bacterium]